MVAKFWAVPQKNRQLVSRETCPYIDSVSWEVCVHLGQFCLQTILYLSRDQLRWTPCKTWWTKGCCCHVLCCLSQMNIVLTCAVCWWDTVSGQTNKGHKLTKILFFSLKTKVSYLWYFAQIWPFHCMNYKELNHKMFQSNTTLYCYFMIYWIIIYFNTRKKKDQLSETLSSD